MLNNKIIGFIYRVDYTGNNEKIKDLSYAGSKKLPVKLNGIDILGLRVKRDAIKL